MRNFGQTISRSLGSLFVTGLVSALLVGAGGCAPTTTKGDTTTGGGDGGVTFELQQPTLTSLAPNTVALGDTVTVFGKDFIDPKHGTLMLYLKGSFTDTTTTQQTRQPGVSIPLTYAGPGQATFVMGPNVVFDPTGGNTLGTFSGNVQVVSTLTVEAANGQPNDMQVSEPQTLSMTVGPSIFIDQLGAVGANCDPITSGTAGSTNIAVGLHFAGMPDATSDDPVTYSFSFNSPTLTASYAQDQTYGLWPLDASVPQVTSGTGNPTFSFPITTGNSVLVDPTTQQQTVTVNPPVDISQVAQSVSQVKLSQLATGPFTDMGSTNMALTVTATHQSGTSISRTINFPVWSAVEVQQFSGDPVPVQYFPAEETDCVYSTPPGISYNYTEGSSETKTYTASMSWNLNQTTMLGLQEGTDLGFGLPVIGGVEINLVSTQNDSWSQTFGVDTSTSVSSEMHSASSYTLNCITGEWCVSFRQPRLYHRSVPVIAHTACGVTAQIGTAVLDDWHFFFDTNYGPSCDNTVSHLPPAETF